MNSVQTVRAFEVPHTRTSDRTPIRPMRYVKSGAGAPAASPKLHIKPFARAAQHPPPLKLEHDMSSFQDATPAAARVKNRV